MTFRRFKKITFYNGFHNGDLHVSRELVRRVVNKLRGRCEFSYAHNNSPETIKDLGIKQIKLENINRFGQDVIKDNTLFINTWYGAKERKYLKAYGTSFRCLYMLFDDICRRRFKFPMEELESDLTKFYPKIDFAPYKTKDIDAWIQKRPRRKRILISNGKVLSGQTKNWPFYSAIQQLAGKHKNIDFILTNKIGDIRPSKNIFLSRDIIKKPGCDLNENAYLSTKCHGIVGKWSGAYTFAFNQCNLFDRDCTFLVFLQRNHEKIKHTWIGRGWVSKIKYRANVTFSEKYQNPGIIKDIDILCGKI